MTLKERIKKRIDEALAQTEPQFASGKFAETSLDQIPEDYLINYLMKKGRQKSTAELTYAVQKSLIDRGAVMDVTSVDLKTIDPIDIIVYFLCHVDHPQQIISAQNKQAAQLILKNLGIWLDLTERMPFRNGEGKSYNQASTSYLKAVFKLLQDKKPAIENLLILYPHIFFEKDKSFAMVYHALQKRKGEKDTSIGGEYLDGGKGAEHNVILRISRVSLKVIKGKSWRVLAGETREGNNVVFFIHASLTQFDNVKRGQVLGLKGKIMGHTTFDDRKSTILSYLSQFMVNL